MSDLAELTDIILKHSDADKWRGVRRNWSC